MRSRPVLKIHAGTTHLMVCFRFRSLVVDVYQGANRCPMKQPGSIFSSQVDTAMTHGSAKIIMPVCAMQSVSLVEIHDIGHVRQIITGAGHASGSILYIDIILAGYGGVQAGSSGNGKRIDDGGPFECVYHLLVQVNIDPSACDVSRILIMGCFWRGNQESMHAVWNHRGNPGW